MERNKHVYVQKPITHNIREARILTELARKQKVVTQMGNQGGSNPLLKMVQNWVDTGKVGKISEVKVWTNRPVWPQGVKMQAPNTIVELSANPVSEWVFVEWKGDLSGSENPTQITIKKPKKIIAVFQKKQYPLNIEIEGEGSVEETVIKPGVPNSYNSGTIVSIEAIPQNGWSFLKWSG